MPEAMKLCEWIDKLCGIMIKMHYFNHQKLKLRKQRPLPAMELHKIQVTIDNLNEQRYAVWNEIEKTVEKIMKGEYKPQKEERTYGR